MNKNRGSTWSTIERTRINHKNLSSYLIMKLQTLMNAGNECQKKNSFKKSIKLIKYANNNKNNNNNYKQLIEIKIEPAASRP